jgi:hypothetical protein
LISRLVFQRCLVFFLRLRFLFCLVLCILWHFLKSAYHIYLWRK